MGYKLFKEKITGREKRMNLGAALCRTWNGEFEYLVLCLDVSY